MDPPKRTTARSVPREKERKREREKVRIFEISSRKIIAYLRVRYRAVLCPISPNSVDISRSPFNIAKRI